MLYLISLWLRVHVCLFLCISYGNLDRGPFVFERLKFIAVVRHCEFSVGGGNLQCLIISVWVAVV
jgi:hypothetical protein